ncbi:unnamed protein product [Cuscuta europaea]|uniref:Uncharacterized protein n=1 Tax=Cuscuta europaea TaxID=41803 RepID=A0A9P1EJW4_CUSEU|nr:unnamed protein product [Cuscuta europaea]
MLTNSTRTLSNLWRCRPPTPFALVKGVLSVYQPFIHMKEEEVWTQVCWTIPNITAGTRNFTSAIIAATIIIPLVHFLHDVEVDNKKEAAGAISKATSGGSHDHIRCLARTAALRCFTISCSVRIKKLLLSAFKGSRTF